MLSRRNTTDPSGLRISELRVANGIDSYGDRLAFVKRLEIFTPYLLVQPDGRTVTLLLAGRAGQPASRQQPACRLPARLLVANPRPAGGLPEPLLPAGFLQGGRPPGCRAARRHERQDETIVVC
jgi:hypothetical protein